MMTRPPNVSPETLRTLTDGWLLGQIHSIRPHHGGSSGSAKYAIESTEGRFLLKGRPCRALSPERLQLMRSVMAMCLKAGLPVPELRPQADGARHIEQAEFVWELQTWMDGKNAQRGRRYAQASGIALAMFHRATRDHPTLNQPSVSAMRECSPLVKRTTERVPGSKTTLQKLEALVLLARSKSAERGLLTHSKQIVHGDWHPKNLRLNPSGRVSGILDFDGVRVDAVAHDLANAVLQVSLRRPKDLAPSQWPSGLHFQAGQRLTSAWRSRIGKTPPEGTWSMLPWLMIETIAMETMLPVAVWGEIPGIDVQEWIQAGAETAEWIRERSRSLAEALIPTR